MNKNLCAPTPPMGWNSWDCYGAAVAEEQLLGNAEYMAKHLKNHGWQYIVCDIQWYEPKAHSNDYNNFTELEMDEFSRLIPAVNRFPSAANGAGFKPISDKIHAMGLKFGIHIMRGIPRQAVHRNTPLLGTSRTAREIAHPFSLCPWNTDMYGVNCRSEGAQEYYNSLFSLYASWGVDFVKVDDICNTEFKPHEPYSARGEIEMIRRAIDNCGRSMVLSLSPGPASLDAAEHLMQNANMWRMTGDFWDDWEKLKAMFERCREWSPFVGGGCWPDCDMLPLGKLCLNADCNGARGRQSLLTQAEQVTLMTLWSVFRSPLMFGGELRENDERTLELITNDEVLAVNQNSSAAALLVDGEGLKVWGCTAENANKIAAVFNLSDEAVEYDLPLSLFGAASARLRDLWARADIGDAVGTARLSVEAHGARLLELRDSNPE